MLVFNYTCIGHGHIQSNKACQDASFCEENDHLSIAIVSDGHGGHLHPRSAMGAQFAVEAAKIVINKNLKEWDNPEKRQSYFTLLWVIWRNMVLEHFQDHPLTSDEENMLLSHAPEIKDVSNKKIFFEDSDMLPLYGCTLIAACVHSNGWFAFQIGDGKCVIINRNTNQLVSEPIPEDDRCFLNTTTSLCDTHADSEFRYFGGNKHSIPDAIFLGTDGIDNSWGSESALHNFYMDILKYCSSQDIVINELEKSLPKLSELGSRDDMSIAAIIDQSTLSQVLPKIYQFQIDQCEQQKELQNSVIEQYRKDILSLQTKLNDAPEDEFLQRDLNHFQSTLAQHECAYFRLVHRLSRLQREFSSPSLHPKL